MADRRAVDREVKFVVSALCRQRMAQASCCHGWPFALLLALHRYLIAIHLIVIWAPGRPKHPGPPRAWSRLPKEGGPGCLRQAKRGERALACPPQAASPCVESRYWGWWQQPAPGCHPLWAARPCHMFQIIARKIFTSAPDTISFSINPTQNAISRWLLLPCCWSHCVRISKGQRGVNFTLNIYFCRWFA